MGKNKKALAILGIFVLSAMLIILAETKILVKPAAAGVITGNGKKETPGQIKKVLETFESMRDGQDNFENDHLFLYGSTKIKVTSENTKGKGYSGARAVKATWTGTDNFGGWGKGIPAIKVDFERDRFNFFVICPKNDSGQDHIRVVFQDDDNNDTKFEDDQDDAWTCTATVKASGNWEMVSIPFKSFQDSNAGGNSKKDLGEGQTSLITFMFEFPDQDKYKPGMTWYFDHVSITRGALPIGKDISEAPVGLDVN